MRFGDVASPLKLPFKYFFEKHSDLFRTVTVVMKHNALLGILEKLTGDRRTALEHELLELPCERNCMAWHGMACHRTEQNGQ